MIKGKTDRMEAFWKKSISKYLVVIVAFVVIALIYFSPLLEGKKLNQHDITMWRGQAKEIIDYREATGEEALWTNSMFGGMPAWQISVIYPGNLVSYIDKAVNLGLPYPANRLFLYFLGFFILMLVLKVDPWVAMIGAFAFAFSTYFFIIIGAGHSAKAHAIGYMAPVLAGIILTFRGKYWQGALLTAIALALEIKTGHLQITYYLLIIVIIYGVYQLIETILSRNYNHFFKASGILIIAAILSASTYTTNLLATYSYGNETIRGASELTKDSQNKSSGLDKDYITAWSYGIGETWSLIIPNVKGGASGLLGNVSAIKHADPAYRSAISQQTNAYWGDQPGTSGPVYIGIIVMFLFIMGFFIVDNRLKWALLVATVLSILLAWGKNWMPFTDFFIDYIPGYNKFRAVSMTLVIAELTIPILAFMAFGKIISNPEILRNNKNLLYYSFGLTGGILLVFYIMPSVFFDFLNTNEKLQFADMMKGSNSGQAIAYLESLERVRMSIFKADVLRSFVIVSLAAILVYLFMISKIKKGWLLIGIGVLILVDMVSVDRRYLNNDNFVRAKQADVPFTAGKADKYIFNDKDLDYRVLDISTSTFNDARCSYFHKSIGGYHGAKLRRYQDLIEEYIQPEINELTNVLRSGPTLDKINNQFANSQVLNMLNTQYVIYNLDAIPLVNSYAYGNAWFVDSVILAENADEEIAAIGKTDLLNNAIVNRQFVNQVENAKFEKSATAAISLDSYAPNYLVYNYESSTSELVVFSEVFHDKGWNAYIDGNLTPHFRVDYILRALLVPKGKHKIEFRFEPRIWVVGERISFIASMLLILMLVAALAFEAKKSLPFGKK